ncbi:MAG: hypothetical protein HZB91_05430 [Elusimicrobia bacterium]|nr:hypothetical protein [Elusimicrobiota bacterium]
MIRQRARSRMIAVLSLAAAAGVLVWQRVQATRFGYEVEAARARVRVLRGHLMSEGMQWEKTIAPAQLAHHARTRLRMQPAGPESIRILDAAPVSAVSGSGIRPRPFGILTTVRQTLSALRRPT